MELDKTYLLYIQIKHPNKNLGFYIPPPMNFTGMTYNNQAPGFYQNTGNNDTSGMLQDIMISKPSFGGDFFGGPVFQSQLK
jgi:hypothetical protein